MLRIIFIGVLALNIFLIVGCDKEKIVESKEYVQKIEYVELPPDTVFQIDTVLNNDSILIYNIDTIVIYDTMVQYSSDTVIMVNYVYDTIETIVHHYDTIRITDTVSSVQCNPNEHLAFAALQYYCDPLVIDLVNLEFGLTDGWIFYLSEFQVDLSKQSINVYDIYGYIDYWTTDWSGYYPIEYYWRLSYAGGDPSNTDNWQLLEPPAGVSGDLQPGLELLKSFDTAPRLQR